MTEQLNAEEFESYYLDLIYGGSPADCNVENIAAFAKDFAQSVPPALGVQALNQFKALLQTNPSQKEICEFIFPMITILKNGGFYEALARYNNRIADAYFADFIHQVNDASSRERRVVFVAHLPYFQILREAMYLRRNGHRAYLVSLEPIPDHLSAVFTANFDAVIDTRRSPSLMGGMLRQLEPEIFHVQCWMWSYWLGRLTIENKGGAAVVCEFYDITSIHAVREALIENWGAVNVDFDFVMENFILHNADGVVHRYSQEIVNKWMERNDAKARQIEFQSYSCPEFLASNSDKPSRKDGVIRMIYAGTLLPQNSDHPISAFCDSDQPTGFRKLLEQGFAVDVFVSPYNNFPGPGLEPFEELTQKFERFRIVNSVSPERFADAIKDYDFGVMLVDIKPLSLKNSADSLKGATGTKIFSYLEAELPIIVNGEYEYMSSFVIENGVGLAVLSKDIGGIKELLTDFDYAGAVENIRKYNSHHGMDTEIHRLINLYDEALTR